MAKTKKPALVKKPSTSVDEWAKTAKPTGPVRCRVCADPQVKEAVQRFYDLKAANETPISWTDFHRLYLLGEMGWEYSYEALMNHVRRHIRGLSS